MIFFVVRGFIQHLDLNACEIWMTSCEVDLKRFQIIVQGKLGARLLVFDCEK